MFEISSYMYMFITFLYHFYNIIICQYHRLVKTIGQFVYLTVQVNLKCLWDNRDIESIKCGTVGIKPEKQPLIATGDRNFPNKAIYSHKREGDTKQTGTSYNFDKVWSGAPDSRFRK